MAKDVDAEMEFSKNNVEAIPRNRTTLYNLKMFHEDTTIMRSLLKDVFGQSSETVNGTVVQTEVSLNQSYFLRYKLPNNNMPFIEVKVMLENGAIDSSFGTQNLLDLNFRVLYE
jgi:hypothetical protein